MAFNWDDFWKQYLPPSVEKPWTPTYEPQQYVSEPDNAGGVQQQRIAIFMFATAETAEHLHQKYAPSGYIALVPFTGTGPAGTPMQMRTLVWQNGVAIIAGILANIWTLNAANPDVAHRLTLDAIASRGAK